jgi:hypothetical protein
MGAKEAIKWNGMTGLELFFRLSIGCALGDSALPLCGFCLLSTIYYPRSTIEDWKRQWGAKEAIKWNGMTGLELFFRGSIGCALGDSALPLGPLAALSAIGCYLCDL